jgi:hypothetical protein
MTTQKKNRPDAEIDHMNNLVAMLNIGVDFDQPVKWVYTKKYWDLIAGSEELPKWIEELRDAETNLRRFRLRLEALHTGSSLTCAYCGKEFHGRKGAKFCSPSHRAMSSRKVKATSTEDV